MTVPAQAATMQVQSRLVDPRATDQGARGANSVSVIVPVKNGMPHFRAVCAALRTQDYDAPFEVICIDSGSKDGSDQLAEDSGFRLVRISSSEFGHGRTRNFGASLSQAEFLAFITHDAIPADARWLSQLVAPLRADPRVAGAFGRHVAHLGADPYTEWELRTHFHGLEAFPVVEITDRAAYDANVGLQQVYHFYSDNASAMRRSVWQDHPYPDVQFAEDQLWAKQIVEAGWRKAFAKDAVVHHSHAFGPFETLQRSFDESRAFRKLFGYRLGQSVRQTCRSVGYLASRDMKLARDNGWWRSHPGVTATRLMQAVARPVGHYLGARDTLPHWLTKRLSRDDWIRNLQ